MKSIQTKILIVVISALLVITVAVSAIAVSMTHSVMHKDADRILKNAAEREAAKINDVLGDVMKSSSIMEHYATTDVEDTEDFKDEEFLEKYLADVDMMFAEVALNTTDIEGFFIRIDPSVSHGKSGFYKLFDENAGIVDMPLTDLDKYDRNDEQNVGWYYAAVNAGRGVWLEPYYFPGQDTELISFVQPLYKNGELFGVIGFDMNFSHLVRRIEEIAVYEDGYAVLMAKDGKTEYNNALHEAGHEPHTEAVVELKNGMFLSMHADYIDIQHDVRPMLRSIVLAFAAVLVLSIIYTVIVTKRIVGPLKRLTASAQRLSVGDVAAESSRVEINSKDEIGTLSRALVSAYSKIREYTAYVNTLAYRDSLTGIKNSTAYAEAILEINHEILTSSPKFGVLVADINNLKETNDKYGHDVGNDLIVHTSKILVSVFKDSAVYRIGGDEFAVILRGEDILQYHTLLDKLDEACRDDYISVRDDRVPICVARGVALFDREIDRVYEDVFSKADHAMYMNKEQSKSIVAK